MGDIKEDGTQKMPTPQLIEAIRSGVTEMRFPASSVRYSFNKAEREKGDDIAKPMLREIEAVVTLRSSTLIEEEAIFQNNQRVLEYADTMCRRQIIDLVFREIRHELNGILPDVASGAHSGRGQRVFETILNILGKIQP